MARFDYDKYTVGWDHWTTNERAEGIVEEGRVDGYVVRRRTSGAL